MGIGEDDTAPGFIFGRRHPAKALSDTDFADDIVLLYKTINQTQELNQHVIQLPSISTHRKAKYLAFSIDNQRQSDGAQCACLTSPKLLLSEFGITVSELENVL